MPLLERLAFRAEYRYGRKMEHGSCFARPSKRWTQMGTTASHGKSLLPLRDRINGRGQRLPNNRRQQAPSPQRDQTIFGSLDAAKQQWSKTVVAAWLRVIACGTEHCFFASDCLKTLLCPLKVGLVIVHQQ